MSEGGREEGRDYERGNERGRSRERDTMRKGRERWSYQLERVGLKALAK